MTTILVTGATGNVGREVVARLAAAGVSVRTLVRDARRAPEGVEAVEGDLAVPATLEPALAGVEAVFLIWPFLTAEGAPPVLDVLERHVRRVVYLSSSGVNAAGVNASGVNASGVDSASGRRTDPINQLHADMERLITGSGMEWTVLRADTIASNTRGWAAQIRDAGVVRGPEIAPTAVVDPRDVAAVAARVLAGGGHTGQTYVLTGPEVIGRADQVRAIGEAVGRPLRFEKVPVEEARARMLADGRPPALVEALLSAAGTRARSGVVTTTVEQLTGAPARTFAQWAADHAADFR
ncbi:NAD(P)H-binding protein [Nonomuraea sp. 3-1Str]|uniref:NAD(P)H-binding protein n=1 Tax=Nonomuraea sp. 3-1Str TaxID=2929801 RepID=UPI00285D1B39|nr:NAD(P)H-binding protein [Nonomuraea sp. 3-1Str]MDR8409870.1 NAD(P)H-binding protein [Nonomuraea sp. 3-1Str]